MRVSLENLPEAAIVVGRDGAIVDTNLRAIRLFGYERDQLTSLTIDSLIPDPQRSRRAPLAEELFAESAAGPVGAARELRVTNSDGREFPVEIAFGSIDGGTCALVVIRDISAALQLRDELLQSEERFRLSALHTADTLQYVNVEKDLYVWYTDVDRVLGYGHQEFPRTLSGWFELIHPDDVDRIKADVDRIIENGEPGWNFRYRIRAKDGSYRHWLDRGTVTGLLDGRPNEGVGAIVDETEQVLAWQKLEDSLEEVTRQSVLNRSILNSLDSHLVVLDREGQIVAADEAWKEFASENDADSNAISTNYLDACPVSATDDAKLALAGVRSVLDGSKAKFEMEYACHSPSRERYFSMTVTPLKAEAAGVVVAHQDVTERVLARKELERALSEIERLKDRLEAEGAYLMKEIKSDHDFEEIVGDSAAMMATFHQVEQVAPTDASVLLHGETGTGKELLARAIHARSQRKDRPLVKVDCTTLPAGLIESELFGHRKGAFTGAHESMPGRFELADGGTIFLDEIGELPLELQGKLLRVIQEGEIHPVGEKGARRVDVRIIAATNRDLQNEIREGRFRSDLFYRIGVFPIGIPPLRDRLDDVPLLTSFFVTRMSKKFGRKIERVSDSMMDALMSYDWPGNVRELQNVVERALIVNRGSKLRLTGLLGDSTATPPDAEGSLPQNLRSIERKQILEALEASRWKVKGVGNAASRLGLTPSTLRSRMKSLGIERPH